MAAQAAGEITVKLEFDFSEINFQSYAHHISLFEQTKITP